MNAGRALRWLLAQTFEVTGGNSRARRQLDGSCAAVLMYHRILPEPEARRCRVEPGMFVTPETFARHCAWLGEHFRVLPLHEVADRLATERPLPFGACAITFDDGWKDNHDHALPELRRNDFPATIFVVTDRIGTRGAFWPDEVRLHMASLKPSERRRLATELGAPAARDPSKAVLVHLSGLPEAELGKALDLLASRDKAPVRGERQILNWAELERMAQGGFDVESHGATHTNLTRLCAEDLNRDLASSRATLRERGYGRRGLVAYPFGALNRRVTEEAIRAGYRAGFSVARGLASSREEPMALPRLAIHEDVSQTRAEFLFRIPGAA